MRPRSGFGVRQQIRGAAAAQSSAKPGKAVPPTTLIAFLVINSKQMPMSVR
jgi:hypothetical protein